MLWTVVRIEARNMLAEHAVWASLALLAAWVAYAAWTGSSAVQSERQALALAVAEQDGRLQALRTQLHAIEAGGPPARHTEDPADPWLVGQKLAASVAVLPPGPLAAVAVGQRDLAPGIVAVTTQGKLGSAARGEATLAGPTRLMTGAFDLAFVFVYLLPLVIIALTYDLLAGERERGTLALVLAQPVSLATFVLGKTLQRGLVVSIVTVGLAWFAVAGSAGGLATGDGALRLLLYLAALIAYAGFWFAAAVAVNARGQGTASNALALVGLWLTLVVVVPGIVRVVVQAAYPPPSRVELVNLTRAAAAEIEAELSALEGNHAVPASDQAGAATLRVMAVQEALQQRAAPVLLAFRTQLAAQQALIDQVRFVSPAIVLHEALGDVAGTGASRVQQFTLQVEAFQTEWRKYFFARVQARQRLTSADHATLPRFTFVEEAPAVLATRVGGGIAGLLLPTVLLVAFAAHALRRGTRVF